MSALALRKQLEPSALALRRRGDVKWVVLSILSISPSLSSPHFFNRICFCLFLFTLARFSHSLLIYLSFSFSISSSPIFPSLSLQFTLHGEPSILCVLHHVASSLLFVAHVSWKGSSKLSAHLCVWEASPSFVFVPPCLAAGHPQLRLGTKT